LIKIPHFLVEHLQPITWLLYLTTLTNDIHCPRSRRFVRMQSIGHWRWGIFTFQNINHPISIAKRVNIIPIPMPISKAGSRPRRDLGQYTPHGVSRHSNQQKKETRRVERVRGQRDAAETTAMADAYILLLRGDLERLRIDTSTSIRCFLLVHSV
jgi:hypothetical protein